MEVIGEALVFGIKWFFRLIKAALFIGDVGGSILAEQTEKHLERDPETWLLQHKESAYGDQVGSKTCNYCGTENEADALNCLACGHELTVLETFSEPSLGSTLFTGLAPMLVKSGFVILTCSVCWWLMTAM